MIQTIILFIGLIGVGIGCGLDIATVRTTLPDYEMAVGLCVNNDGVDFMTIESQINSDDYMESVTCINGAEFKLNPPSNYFDE